MGLNYDWVAAALMKLCYMIKVIGESEHWLYYTELHPSRLEKSCLTGLEEEKCYVIERPESMAENG